MSKALEAPELEADGEETVAEVEEAESDLIELALGRELSEAQGRCVTIARDCRLIVLAGPPDCGKTTVLTSVYELFQQAEMPSWLFSWCHTLPGMERRCHPSRVESNRDHATTERTSTYSDDDARYLHLRVAREESPTESIDLLFTDLSGEVFERARDSVEDCRTLKFLRRADHFVILLDGNKFAQPARRHAVEAEADMLLRSCLDSGMIGASTFVDVLFAKSDDLASAGTPDEVNAFCQSVEARFRHRFTAEVGRLHFARIAARPEPGRGIKFGEGLAECIGRWASSSPRQRPMCLRPPTPSASRESHAFFERHFAQPA